MLTLFLSAIKELVTDGNLDCTEEGIVSVIPPSRDHIFSSHFALLAEAYYSTAPSKPAP